LDEDPAGGLGPRPLTAKTGVRRVLEALESEGVRFSEDGIRLERPGPTISATVISEGAAA